MPRWGIPEFVITINITLFDPTTFIKKIMSRHDIHQLWLCLNFIMLQKARQYARSISKTWVAGFNRKWAFCACSYCYPISLCSNWKFDYANFSICRHSCFNQAFDRGEITEEERLLYLAYALYESESLPARFHGNEGWFGEGVLEELEKAANSPEVFCSMSPHIRSEFQRLLHPDTICN